MKIKDIAKLANVSNSAVSLALNGKPGISEATREKILKITKEHGYTTRSLMKTEELHPVSSKLLRFVACTNVGIVSEKYESLPFFMELLRSIDESIRSRGYSLTVSSINYDSFNEEIIRLEEEQKSDGIILLGTNLSPQQIRYIADKQPNLVVIDTCFETMNVDFIVMNNVMGAYDAAKYLLNQGHTKIGYVESITRFNNFDMRKQGFLQALEEHRLSLDKKHIYAIPPTDVTPQELFMQRISKERHDLPTALFCECDYMAISVIKSLAELGIRVPQDISIVGFDNIWESQIIHPELTTINVKKDRIATLAVERLVQRIEETCDDRIKLLVDTDLVVRNSAQALKKVEVSTGTNHAGD